ncbi:MAG: thiol peroxidase [Gammaproteobacteria bacterium]|nr:thiol peroxidase [Gammaproteobacteria bacterium]
MAKTMLGDNEVTLSGDLPKVGDAAPDFSLVDGDLQDKSLGDFAGKKKLLNIFPSMDTPTCALSTKKFNDHAKAHDDTVMLMVSADLPFAQKRFCGDEGLENVISLSTMRGREGFDKGYGLFIQDGPLAGVTARAVVVIDANDKVVHTELVPNIGDEPDYNAALEALDKC